LNNHATIHHGCWYSSLGDRFVKIPADELLAKHQKVRDGQVHRRHRVDPIRSASAAPEHASSVFITPWIMLLSPIPREDQEDATEMEEASPSPVCSQPTGFPRWVSSIQSLAGLAPPPLPTGSLDRTTLAGPLRSVWILKRSSRTLATSPPLLRRTRSSTSPYYRHSRRWPAAWCWRTSPNSCVRCPLCSHGVDGPLSLRSSLLSSWAQGCRDRGCAADTTVPAATTSSLAAGRSVAILW